MFCLRYFFKAKEAQSCFSPKENSVWSWHLLSGLDSPHAGKEETHKGQEMMGHKNACVCRRQGLLLFSQCPMRQWKKKGQNEKDPSPPSSTYYIPLQNRGKAETGKTRSLLNLQPLYIPFMVSNVTLQKSYHSPLNCLEVTQSKQHKAEVQSRELHGEKSSCSFPI